MSACIYGILLLFLVVLVITVVLKINFNINVMKKIKSRVSPNTTFGRFLRCALSSKCPDLYKIWIYMHAVFYFILGNLIPGKWWFIVFTIIVWESFEHISSSKQVWFREKFWKKTVYDIIVDVAAYYLGTQFC